MSEVRVNNLSNENSTGGPTISGITTFSSPYFFVPPKGDTASRPQDCPPGSLRFNTDTAHLEYFRGDTIGWVEFESLPTAPIGGRMLIGGGSWGSPIATNTIEYVTISTLGNSKDFGDLNVSRGFARATASWTRGIFAGGRPSHEDIDYVTIAELGNALDFGNLSVGREDSVPVSDGTRGVLGGGGNHPGSPAYLNTIDFITIPSTGNATDFGDLTTASRHHAAVENRVRGVWTGAYGETNRNTIQYITIQTTGNAVDFGDLNVRSYGHGGLGNNVRGLIIHGRNHPAGTNVNSIDYITINTTGNATDFGDTTQLHYAASCSSSPTRGIIAGGAGGAGNTIEYLEIMTTGNASDFGDVSGSGFSHSGGTSNAHGGL